jgi:hypothetical protein
MTELPTFSLHRIPTEVAGGERPLWRRDTFEGPSAYAGCTLKPVIGVAIFRPIGRPVMAGTAPSRSTPTAAFGHPGDQFAGSLSGLTSSLRHRSKPIDQS